MTLVIWWHPAARFTKKQKWHNLWIFWQKEGKTSLSADNRRMIRLVSVPRRHLLRVFIVGNVKATTKKAEVSVSRGICYVSYKTLANTTMNCTNGFLQNFGTYHNELYRWFSRCNTLDHNETETKSFPIEHIDTFPFL